jgi:hypothetical protein
MAITRSMAKNQTNTSERSQIQTRSQTQAQSQHKISPKVINILNRISSLPINDVKIIFNRLEKMIKER